MQEKITDSGENYYPRRKLLMQEKNVGEMKNRKQ